MTAKIQNTVLSKILDFKPTRQNVRLSYHFKQQVHKKRGMEVRSIQEPAEYIKGVFRKLKKNDLLIQRFKGKDRIIIVTRGLKLIISLKSFLFNDDIVLITLLSGKMRTGGHIKKQSKRNYKTKTKMNSDLVNYELEEGELYE